MPHVPDTIINKKAVKFRNTLVMIAILAGLFGYGALNAGNTGPGFIAGFIGGALLLAATKVKTKRHYQDSISRYR